MTLKAPGAPARGQSALYSRITADAIANQAKVGVEDAAEHIAHMRANPGLANAVANTFSNAGNYMASRAGRVAEAGADGYIIGMLNDQDPLELATFGAGGQAAGSLALSIATAPFEGGSINMKKLAGTAIGFAAVTQLIKEIVPGGEDNIFRLCRRRVLENRHHDCVRCAIQLDGHRTQHGRKESQMPFLGLWIRYPHCSGERSCLRSESTNKTIWFARSWTSSLWSQIILDLRLRGSSIVL